MVCFLHFDFEVCFAPTTACTFWHLSFQKCSEREDGVQLFISHLASWLRTRRFSEPTFRPSGTTNHWKNAVNRDFPTFSRTCILFLITLSLLWSSLFCSSLFWLFPTPLLFHLSILSEVWLLNFLRFVLIIAHWDLKKRYAGPGERNPRIAKHQGCQTGVQRLQSSEDSKQVLRIQKSRATKTNAVPQVGFPKYTDPKEDFPTNGFQVAAANWKTP